MKEFQSYYTNSESIVNCMINLLEVKDNDSVLEPCAGEGVFIDELISRNQSLVIDALDMDSNAIGILKTKYKDNLNIRIKETDTLLDTEIDMIRYDRIIGNPPYGAWQDYDKRKLLKEIFPDFYVKETYTLFMIKCLRLLKINGVLTFIVPSTFLSVHMHKQFRKFLINNYTVETILIFPSKFFPNLSFGYSKLSIVKIRNIEPNEKHKIQIYNDFRSVEQLNKLDDMVPYELFQSHVSHTKELTFFLNDKPKLIDLIKNKNMVLGDIADCVTGIYTGNNKKYTRKLDDLSEDERKHFVFYAKRVSKKYELDTKHFIDWSNEAIDNYHTDKKARFQNSQFYFKKEIALPMVKTSQIKSALMNNVVFDQSIVGIFPKDEKYLYYLLAYLNSNIATEILNLINPSANNSSNYVKRIPVILPNEEQMIKINSLVSKILIKYDLEIIKEINEIINMIYA